MADGQWSMVGGQAPLVIDDLLYAARAYSNPRLSRLARKILHLTETEWGAGDTLDMSQSELADFVGATREAVSKTL